LASEPIVMTSSPSTPLENFRAQFPVTRERTYLITGAIAPAAEPVSRALGEWEQRLAHQPLLNFDGWADSANEARRRFADLINADSRRIAITDGTSRGADIAISLLADAPGLNVVVDPTTYPSSIEPWLWRTRKRVVASAQELDAAAVERLGDGQLAAVVISHVAWQTGHRHDLRALATAAHAQGGLLIVDAAQSAGVVPIDVIADGVDVLMTTAMKWLLGVPGVGFLYVIPEVLARHRTRPWPGQPEHRPPEDARRLEPGVPSLPSIAAANAALELLATVGPERISAHVETLAQRCIAGLVDLGLEVLTPVDRTRRAGVIAFRHAHATELSDRLRTRRIDVMGRDEWGFVRVDPAGFNTTDDIDRFLGALDALADASH
jgi:selenocysteine lyase/cysteine desulfurase